MKAKILFVFFTYIFFTGTRAEAQGGVLPLNNTVNGTLSSSTPDIWDITTTSDGLLKLSLNAVSPADLFMTLYDNNGTTIIGGPVESFNNSSVTSITDGLAPGSYHIKISPFGMSTGSYTLTDSFFTASLTNDVEPNRSAATAVTLPINSGKTGHVGYYYNSLRDTTDWYKVTTTADGLLRVYLTTARGSVYSNNTLDVNMTLYDNNGTTQLANVEVFNGNGPAANFMSADGLAPGTYYIKVEPFSANQFADYTISDSLFTPSLANDTEPNGTSVTAVVLPLNSGKTDHVGYYYNSLRDTADWYKVTTTADGLLRVSLTTARSSVYSNNTLDVNMTLYDNNGTTQLANVEVFNGSGPAANFMSADGLAPGTYYIKVEPFSANQFADYTISDSLFTPSLANDTEPNGTSVTAVVLPLNSGKTGHVGYYYNSLRDTTDWYKLTTTSYSLLRVYLTTERSTISSTNITNPLDVNVTLYDNNGTTQLGFVEVYNGSGPATNFITADGLAPGTYYIKVEPFSTTEFADYTISDSLFTPSLANDTEPNGTASTADILALNSGSTGHVGYYYNNQRDTADWFKVITTADGLLRVSLTTARSSVYSNNTLDVNMTLYDNNGTTQLANVEVFNGSGPAANFMSADGLAPGTYYIKVEPFSANQFADYTISDSLFTPSLANDTEPNGTSVTAVVLPLNSGKTGHVGYYYNSLRDTADWYKVTTTADGLLRVYLTTARSSVYSSNTLDVNMTLYDNNGDRKSVV